MSSIYSSKNWKFRKMMIFYLDDTFMEVTG